MEDLFTHLGAAAIISLAASGCVTAEWGEPVDDHEPARVGLPGGGLLSRQDSLDLLVLLLVAHLLPHAGLDRRIRPCGLSLSRVPYAWSLLPHHISDGRWPLIVRQPHAAAALPEAGGPVT
ncbi:hypothetical protein [Sorangium sp. So ce861]|uniref:hypothetical protein n=1 Tax=Sorangium sp. So ce861 TaxID=3133323 RepID=UPI003F6246F3